VLLFKGERAHEQNSDSDDDKDDDESALHEDWPTVVDRGHPSWATVDAEQRERLGDPPTDQARP